MMREKIFVIAAAIVFLTLINDARALSTSSDDLWDVSQGTVVTGNSDLHHISNPANMFGNSIPDYQYHEGENTIFVDGKPTGFVHWIEWETLNPVSINSFNLVASHDPTNTAYRAISTFNLYSWSGGFWDLIYSYDASNPYGGGETYTEDNFLELYDTFSTVIAQDFRAEFVQYSDAGGGLASGPRIHELDGYYTVPEPCSVILMSLGLLGFVSYRKNSKNS